MQQQFSQALRDLDDRQLLSEIHGQTDEERLARLAVYRNNVYVSLIQSLKEVYPVCLAIVGEAFFDALAFHYVQQYPPTNPVLSTFGEHLAEFAQTLPQLESIPYFSELAALEYRLLRLTHMADPSPLSGENIQALLYQCDDPTQTQWQFITPITLWQTRYAVGAIYFAHQPNPPCPLSEVNWQQKESLLLTKHALYGQCYILSQEAWHIISQLQEGLPLAIACASISEQHLSRVLAEIIQKPIIQAITPMEMDLSSPQ